MSPLLAYNEVCFKASHNSYANPLTHPPGSAVPWDPAPLFERNVRGFELDLWQVTDRPEWLISHNGEAPDEPDRTLRHYLEAIRHSAEADPSGDPIEIVLDIKSARRPWKQFAEDLDAYLDDAMSGARLVSPRDLLQPGDADLVAAVRRGWGHIAMRGAFLLCLSGAEDAKKGYAAQEPAERRCFADIDLPADKTMTQVAVKKGDRVVINVRNDVWKWGANWLCNNPGFLLRVYGLGRGEWNHVVGTGANILATDLVDELQVGAERFAATVPTRPF